MTYYHLSYMAACPNPNDLNIANSMKALFLIGDFLHIQRTRILGNIPNPVEANIYLKAL